MRAFLLACLAVLALAPAARAAGEPRRIGVYPLERLGPADPAYDRLQDYLRRNLALFPGTEAFDLATPSRCKADDLQCLVTVGRLAAADHVVHGSVERFGDGYAVRLQLIDVGRTTRREAKRLIQGGSAELTAAMELAACELMTTERCQGTLRVDGPDGARLLVGARDLGPLPWAGPLAIGRHSVRVAKGGLSTEDRFINMSFKQDTMLDVVERGGVLAFADRVSEFDAPLLPPELEPEPAPKVERIEAQRAPTPLEKQATALAAAQAAYAHPPASASWMPAAFWGGAVAGGALVAMGAMFGINAQLKASEVNGRFDDRTLTLADKPLYDSARFSASAANVSYGLGTLSLATAAVIYLVDPDVAGSAGDVAVTLGPSWAGAQGSF